MNAFLAADGLSLEMISSDLRVVPKRWDVHHPGV